MNTNSIFLNRRQPTSLAIDDLIPYYAAELRTCENLLNMGWNFSCGVCISERHHELSEEIHRLEELKRRRIGRKYL